MTTLAGTKEVKAKRRNVSITSLFKRWLLGTHQGPVLYIHLQSYLDELRSDSTGVHLEVEGLFFEDFLNRRTTDPTTIADIFTAITGTGGIGELISITNSLAEPINPPCFVNFKQLYYVGVIGINEFCQP